MTSYNDVVEILIGDGELIDIDFERGTLDFRLDNGTIITENIHTFANNLKKSFLYYGTGYCIMSFVDWGDTGFAETSTLRQELNSNADTEAEAIFKLCVKIINFENNL